MIFDKVKYFEQGIKDTTNFYYDEKYTLQIKAKLLSLNVILSKGFQNDLNQFNETIKNIFNSYLSNETLKKVFKTDKSKINV